MKKIIILSLITFWGCSTYKHEELKIEGDGAKCFNDKDIEVLIKEIFKPNDDITTHLFLYNINVSKNSCIGLYSCQFKNITISHGVVFKILKFEDKIYIYSEDEKNENEKVLKEFREKYPTLFSKEEFEKLTLNFYKGTDHRANYF